MKGWRLVFVKTGAARCEYDKCHQPIKYECHIERDGQTMIVGRECVNSFVDEGDAQVALKFFQDEWKQRRSYYYKRAHGRVFIIQRAKTGSWYVKYARSVKQLPWYPEAKPRVWYPTAEKAKEAVLRLVCSGYAKVIASCPLEDE